MTGLKLAKGADVEHLVVHSDSQLVVEQLNGQYEVREDRFKKLLEIARKRIVSFKKFELLQILRGENSQVDMLAPIASSLQ